MSKSLALALTAATGLAAAATSANAATVLNLSNASLCAPSGCFGDTKRTFTHTFSASALAGSDGVFNVSGLRLSKGLFGDMANYGVRITFQTADGTVVGNWGAFTLAVLGGDVVTVGGQAFDWSAAQGDLVLKLDLLVPDKGGAGGGFGGGFGGGGFGGPPSGFSPRDVIGAPPALITPPGGGLVADLRTAMPEPAAWAMMIMGFGAAGAMIRRRRFTYRYG